MNTLFESQLIVMLMRDLDVLHLRSKNLQKSSNLGSLDKYKFVPNWVFKKEFMQNLAVTKINIIIYHLNS